MLDAKMHFAELSSGSTNPTEVIATLINQGEDFVDGICNVYKKVKGSCSMLLLTEDGIIAARDRWGRTPIVIGQKEDGFAATSESSSLPNLGYDLIRDIGPGEIVKITSDKIECLKEAEKELDKKKKELKAKIDKKYPIPSGPRKPVRIEDVTSLNPEEQSLAKWISVEVEYRLR